VPALRGCDSTTQQCASTISSQAFRQALNKAVKDALGKRGPTALGAPPLGDGLRAGA